jgi:PleD family two-component response regulator
VRGNTALTEALTQADSLLYAAKQAGRDRVHVAAATGTRIPQAV